MADTEPDQPAAPESGRHRADPHGADPHGAGPLGRPEHGPGWVLGFTVLGTLVPGLGLVVAGWRRVGVLVLLVAVSAAVALGIWVGSDPVGAVSSTLAGHRLEAVEAATVAVGIAWAVLVVCTHRALRPARASGGVRAGMAVVVGVLCLLILAPTALAASLVRTTDETVQKIFTGGPSATVRHTGSTGTAADPWAHQERVNILLLGGDAGPTAGGKIRSGLRTDTVIVASIDTHTGNTVLFSVGRNTQRLQFQPGTPLAEAYPDGYATHPAYTSTGPFEDNLLNSVYQDVPAYHPGILGDTANEGADALKLGLGYSLFGDQDAIDYYVLISLQGFEQVVNALGGISVNVNKPVPIGGAVGENGAADTLPTAWIMPGADERLDGHDALWFARGRYGSNDRERVARQRCTINAITNQATPARVLAGYQSLADTAANVTQTDIPSQTLPALLTLANRVKSGTRSSLSVDSTGIADFDQFHPDWDQVRDVVATAVARSTATPTRKPAATAAATPGTPAPTPTASRKAAVTIDSDLDESCAYDAAAAAANLADWESTWGSRYSDDGTRR